MTIHNRRQLRRQAAQSLAAAGEQARLVPLIYGGITCALALLSTVISFLLNDRIAETGGLSNMGLRSILSTVQFLLPIVQMVVLMSLELGYHRFALNTIRGRRANSRDLLEGFRRFGPLLRSVLLQSLIYGAIAIAAMYISSFIFMALPVSRPFYALMQPILDSVTVMDAGSVPALDEATLTAAMNAMMPMVWIFAGVFFLASLPVIYSFRMTSYYLADDARPGALAALRRSRWMMRRNRIALFKLDCGFWWYYGLQVLVSLICYGDLLLPMVGITLPWSDTVSYYVFYVLSLVVQLAVIYFFMNRVQVTYAAAYEALTPRPQDADYPM